MTVPAALPDPIDRYLRAREAGDVEGALAQCTPEATLVDIDAVHAGRDAIRIVLARPISERRLTFQTTGSTHAGDDEWDVGQRIDGDLEGGPVDLTYRFTLTGDRISRLHIRYA